MTARRRVPAATACAAWLHSSAPRRARDDAEFRDDGRRRLLLAAGEGMFTVDMGAPRFRWDEIPLAKEMPDTRAIDLQFGPPAAPILRSPSAVSMGNPHAIFWVENPQAYDLAAIGPVLEHDPLFPERANITLAATPSRDRVVIRTWERGAGLTKACGSAACAAAVAAARLGRDRPEGDGHAARRRSRDRVARERRSCADDRTGRVRARRTFRRGAVCRRGGVTS